MQPASLRDTGIRLVTVPYIHSTLKFRTKIISGHRVGTIALIEDKRAFCPLSRGLIEPANPLPSHWLIVSNPTPTLHEALA